MYGTYKQYFMKIYIIPLKDFDPLLYIWYVVTIELTKGNCKNFLLQDLYDLPLSARGFIFKES